MKYGASRKRELRTFLEEFVFRVEGLKGRNEMLAGIATISKNAI
jgi:hypothetical protein